MSLQKLTESYEALRQDALSTLYNFQAAFFVRSAQGLLGDHCMINSPAGQQAEQKSTHALDHL
jgi:hypothetical protein